ncbi:MAG: hypothetical protein IJC51_05700, partial [Eggerthellaceae bacterium]|nr:hypothetical protein [Eggerthellaceae bacterium]
MLGSYATWFDVQRNYEFAGHLFAGYAQYHAHGEQYVLVKRVKLWEADAHEHVFFTMENTLDGRRVQELATFMTTSALEKVDPAPPHMSTALTLVVLADEVTDEAERVVRKTRFRKNYLLGLRGWADVRLAAVDFSRRKAFSNGAGKELVSM